MTTIAPERPGRTTLAASVLLLSLAATPARAGVQDPLATPRDFQDLALPGSPGAPFDVQVVLDGELRTLVLEPHSIRSARYQVRAMGAGGALAPVALPPPATYRGTIAGWPESRVAASLGESGLGATVLGAPRGGVWTIEPAPDAGLKSLLRHAVYRDDEVALPPGFCGSGDLGSGPFDPPDPVGGSPVLEAAEFVFDADHGYYLDQGGTEKGVADAIDAVLNTVGLVYEYYVGVTYTNLGGIVRTSEEDDPYLDFQGDACQLLSFFRNHWNANHGDIHRDTAHLFTGQHLTGSYIGCAGIHAMCTPSLSYGVSVGNGSGLMGVVLLAHELGHTWGACHCNQEWCSQYAPDNCGIMNSGISSNVFFGSSTVEHLVAHVAALSCLEPAAPSPAPVLSSVSPAEVQLLAGSTAELSGSHFDAALFVDANGTVLDLADFTVVDADTITFDFPLGDALGPAQVTVGGPGGSSAPASFEYVEVSPPKIVSEWWPENLFPVAANTWTYGGLVGKTAQLVLSYQDGTTTAGGFEVLADPLALKVETLTSPGLGTYTRPISWSMWGLDFWMQVLLYDGHELIAVSEILHNHVGF